MNNNHKNVIWIVLELSCMIYLLELSPLSYISLHFDPVVYYSTISDKMEADAWLDMIIIH